MVKPSCVAVRPAAGGVAGLPASHVAQYPFSGPWRGFKPLVVGEVAEKL